MFDWFFRKGMKKVEEETKKSFSEVKKDIDVVGKWIKHLDGKDKQLFDLVLAMQKDLSSIHEELEGLREGLDVVSDGEESRQLFKKLPVLDKQTADEDVQKVVQTAVQTDNIYDIFKSLTGNERLVVMTLLNNDMKLSYEDLALLLGKERSTIRGQVNAIKQKCEGLLEEMVEKNGKKRVSIPSQMKEKLAKYARVRVRRGGRKA